MAIKEFVIGPQNYWEEGYFDGDYTLPNVAKFYLQCDIDNVKGGRVVTGEYFQDNYIDGTYWHKNAIEAGLTATADKIKNAQIQATGYFVEGYYATGYAEQGIASVLNATAGVLVGTSAAITSQASTSAQAGKQVDVATSMSAVFSQTAIGSRTSDIDLYAFSQGGLTSDINAIRAYELDALSSFDIATDYIRQRNTSSDAAAEFTQSIAFERNRDNASATQVAFSFGCDAVKTTDNVSTISSSFELTAAITHLEGTDLFAFTNASVSVQNDRFRDNNISSSSEFSIVANNDRFRDNDVQCSTAFNFSVNEQRFRDTGISVSSEFAFSIEVDLFKAFDSNQNIVSSTNVSVEVTRDIGSISLANTLSVSCVISHIHGADIQAFDDAELSGIPSITRDHASSLNVQSGVSASGDRSRDNQSSIQSTFSLDATALRIQPGEAGIGDAFISSTSAVKTADFISSVNISFNQFTDNGRIRETPIPEFYSSSQSTIVGNAVRGIEENFVAETNVSAIIGTLESITLIVFNFASVIALPFISANASSDASSTLSSTASAVKTTECLASLASPFNNINVAGERIRYQESTISVSTSVVADNSRTRDNDSQIQSAATVSAIIGKLEDIDLYAFSNGSLSTDAVVVRNAVINSQLTFSCSVNAGKIPPIEATFSNTISLSADNVRVRFADSTMTASGGVLSVVDVIPGVESHMVGSFTTNRPYVESGYVNDDYATNFETIANYIVDNLHQLSVVSSMSIDAEFSVNGAALIASAGTLQTNAVKIVSTSSVQNVSANVTADGSKFVGFESNTSSTFSIEAKVGSQEDVFVTLFNDVSLTSAVSKSVSVTSTNNIVSTFYANTENSLTTQGEASVVSAFSTTQAADKITGISANIQALAFTVTVGSAIAVEQASLTSSFNINIVGDVIRSIQSALEIDSAVIVSANRNRDINVTISSAMTFVSEVRDLRIDEIEYRIPAEGWEYRIVGENREYDIIGETRLRSVTGESRERRIDGETRIYTIE